MRTIPLLFPFLLLASASLADIRNVYLESGEGERIKIASLTFAEDGGYEVEMDNGPFTDQFLSMRPFKCLEGPQKHWCHVPYPYEIARSVGSDLTDLEYDFLFLWKDATEYGINMWNGVYYLLEEENGAFIGRLHEMDMDILSAPPEAGNLRPVRDMDIEESDPDSHWLPRMIVE